MSAVKNEVPTGEQKQFVTFNMEGSLYGIDILTVKEVSLDFSLTPIYHAPEAVKGYVNLRGEIVLILDLSVALGVKHSSESKSKLIIFKNSIADPFGLIVNSSGDVVTVDDSKIQNFSPSDNKNGLNALQDKQIINGLFKTDSGLIISLDAYKILSIIDQNERDS